MPVVVKRVNLAGRFGSDHGSSRLETSRTLTDLKTQNQPPAQGNFTPMTSSTTQSNDAALNSARRKAYLHLVPLLFVCYIVAYIDRANVAIAKLGMEKDVRLENFNSDTFGYGMGIFFVGYLLLEIPGTLIVERWSARKWISRIMITWGILASMTAFVTKPWHFYTVRFLLGLGEAGFYPGVIVFLTHWFPKSDRTKALALFMIGSPIAQVISPPLSERLMRIGTNGNAALFGLSGWQWVFMFWGLPAVILGVVVLMKLVDKPRQAKWLTHEEREALESALEKERNSHLETTGHMTVMQALSNPRVVILAIAYFFVVTGNYGMEMYMPSILESWYNLKIKDVAFLVIIPPIGSLIGMILVGWNSDRTHERTFHAALPIIIGSVALFLTPFSNGNKTMTIVLFTIGMTGLKAYLPAFWSLPNQFLSASAAAASIGMINSFGNLGGAVGPSVMGKVKEITNDYNYGLWYLAVSMMISAIIIIKIGTSAKARARNRADAEQRKSEKA